MIAVSFLLMDTVYGGIGFPYRSSSLVLSPYFPPGLQEDEGTEHLPPESFRLQASLTSSAGQQDQHKSRFTFLPVS